MRSLFSFVSLLLIVTGYLWYFRLQEGPAPNDGKTNPAAPGAPESQAAAALKQAQKVAAQVKARNAEASSFQDR